MWRSIVDNPKLLTFAIAVLFAGAVAAWSAVAMMLAVRDQRARQDAWLDDQKGKWK